MPDDPQAWLDSEIAAGRLPRDVTPEQIAQAAKILRSPILQRAMDAARRMPDSSGVPDRDGISPRAKAVAKMVAAAIATPRPTGTSGAGIKPLSDRARPGSRAARGTR